MQLQLYGPYAAPGGQTRYTRLSSIMTSVDYFYPVRALVLAYHRSECNEVAKCPVSKSNLIVALQVSI